MKNFILIGAILTVSQFSLAKECVDFSGTYKLLSKQSCNKRAMKEIASANLFLSAPTSDGDGFTLVSNYDFEKIDEGKEVVFTIKQDGCKTITYIPKREEDEREMIGTLDLSKKTWVGSKPRFNVKERKMIHVQRDHNYEFVPFFYEPMMRDRTILTLSENGKQLKLEDKWRYLALALVVIPVGLEIKSYECTFDRID